jgi:hypothetical protein
MEDRGVETTSSDAVLRRKYVPCVPDAVAVVPSKDQIEIPMAFE